MSSDPVMEMLRSRERTLERELIESRIEAQKIVAVADARLSEVRDMIDRVEERRERPVRIAGAAAR